MEFTVWWLARRVHMASRRPGGVLSLLLDDGSAED